MFVLKHSLQSFYLSYACLQDPIVINTSYSPVIQPQILFATRSGSILLSGILHYTVFVPKGAKTSLTTGSLQFVTLYYINFLILSC